MGSGASIDSSSDSRSTQHHFLQNQKLAAHVSANRKINEILIRENGFSKSEIIVSEGENVAFSLISTKKHAVDANESELSGKVNLDDVGLMQVIIDDADHKYRTVVGGYNFEKIEQREIVKFKTAGEYYFKLQNHPLNPPPVKIIVQNEQPVTLLITDDGFLPRILRIEEGTTLKWTWHKLSCPHSMYEAEYCDLHCGLYRTTKELVMPTLTNTYKRKFEEPGVYYFQTESKNADQKNICIVEVIQSYKEHSVEIMDNKFSPARITINEGDKVWFYWSKEKCVKKHCVYQIYPPSPDHPPDKAYLAVTDGFRWTSPSRSGMVCHTFEKCGIYYYGDICGNECASYIGIIAVKRKPEHHFVNYVDESKQFEKDIITVETGDLIWFKWNRSLTLSVNLIDYTLLFDKKIDFLRCQNFSGCQQLESNGLAKSGIYSIRVRKAGCYYFRIYNGVDESIITLIATAAPRDHKIEVTDSDSKPSILNIHPEDRVWFTWDETKRPQNIRQVNHANQLVPDGFLSGSLMESPGAFIECFNNLGIYYYRSDNNKGILGAVVVVPEPTIGVIHVTNQGIDPDPIVIHVNDLVIWEFASDQLHDVLQVKSPIDFYKYAETSKEILPRRFLSRSFKEPGAYHFVSPSFDVTVDPDNSNKTRELSNTIISSIVVDKIEEYTSVLVDSKGFHPALINVELGKSILFDWRDSNEYHNIIHVTVPNDKHAFKVVEGSRAFNSGKLVQNNSFLHTFEEEGVYSVISEGAQNNHCLVHVLKSVQRASKPMLAQPEPFVLTKYQKIYLKCDTPNVTIHFTTDGSTPNKLTEKYSHDAGITMNEEGINIIRAIAYSEQHLTSEIFTSQRFYVLEDPNSKKISSYVETVTIETASELNEEWWRCIPRIVINTIGVGCFEVTWEIPDARLRALVSHFQIFLNKVSYRKYIGAEVSRVIVKGLASARSYEVTVMVFPKSKSLLPQESNKVEIKNAKTTNLGGPVISLKANPIQDQLTVTWLSIDSSEFPIDHYDLLINGEKRETIIPAPGRHYVNVSRCQFDTRYSILIIAIPKDGSIPLISNELEVKLPLDLEEIELPEVKFRDLEKDYYDEYIEIIDAGFERLVVNENELPIPQAVVTHVKSGTISVDWCMSKKTPPFLVLTHYVILLVGTEFTNDIRSDASFECMVDQEGRKLPAVQHSWIIKNTGLKDNKMVIDGIVDTSIYQITINGVFKLVNSTEAGEYKSSSKMIVFTPLGPPSAPRLRVNAVDIQSAIVEWIPSEYAKPDAVSGYKLLVNDELSQTFKKNDREFLFKDMQPGKSYKLEIVTLTNSVLGESNPSNAITVICPLRPNPPLVNQLPSARPYSAVIGWKPVNVRSPNIYDQIICYKIYLNDKFHGEIYSSNTTSYSYMIEDLMPGKTSDVTVQSICGERLAHPVDTPVVSCLIASDYSTNLLVSPAAPPDPVRLRVAAVSTDGIEITWQFPQQYGDAVVSGFQLVKNGRLFGDIIPYDVNSLKLTDVEIGDTVNLQMISLTNHPVGKYTALHNHPNYTMDQPQREQLMNGPSSSSGVNESSSSSKSSKKKHQIVHPDYPACRVGPVLAMKYTGLVKPAVRVWTEKVTGYSALVFYQTSKMNSHFVDAEYYLISYWPGNTPMDNVITIRTENDYVELNNLKPTTIYTVQVESRREVKRSDDVSDHTDQSDYKYIVYSRSNMMQFQTASPPDPPSNLSVVSTTCHAIKVCWDPPIDHGSDIIATRIDCFPLNVEKPMHIYKELTPDTRSCIIDNLTEKTCYKISVTAITREYFVSHKIKEIKQLPKLILDSMPWLPSAHIEAMTSGTEAAINLEWKLKHDKSVSVTWKPPKVYGTNRLINQILSYQELGATVPLNSAANVSTSTPMATQIALPLSAKGYKLQNLKIGSKYKIWVEAVVVIKLNIESDSANFRLDDLALNEDNQRIDYYNQLKDTRCTHVLSEPILLRVPAPCEPVTVNLIGYTSETIDLCWPKPSLYSQHKDPDNTDQKIHLYRHLIGYRIEVNGIRQRSLNPNENFCTLTKCKPGNTYNIVVVAVTCLSSAVENPLVEHEIDVFEIDESFSNPLQVKMFHSEFDHQLTSMYARFEENGDPSEPRTVGRIKVEWDLKDSSDVSQFNVNWFSAEESLTQRKSLDSSNRKCYLPVTKSKCLYEINLEVVYKKSRASIMTERLFIEIPGSPDAPDLWLIDQKDTVVSVQWSEPRVYSSVPVGGYQIYVNDVKVGTKIEKDRLIATLPLKPNRNYKINVQTLSSKASQYADSILSNSLQVNTSAIRSILNATSNTTPIVSTSNTITSSTNVVTTTNYTSGSVSNTATNLDMLVVRGPTTEDDLAIRFNQTQVLALIKFYEQENDREFDVTRSQIPLRFNKITEDYIDLDWSKYSKLVTTINEYKIQWHCLNTNEHFEHRCSPNVLNYRIKRLRAGYTYCIKVCAIRDTNIIENRSRNFIVQMSAPPDAPVLKLRSCNFKYITVEWKKPMSYGEAPIVAYKVYVDGRVEAVVSADQTIFTLSKGEPCHEYSFQIQALTSDESLTSTVSQPLKVVWPGMKLPNLRAIENPDSTVKVLWDDPAISGNGKISFYRVVAESEDTNDSIVKGPFEPSINECDIEGLNCGRYKIYLEVNAYGSAEPFCSTPLMLDFGYKPESPILNASVLGLEERKKLDKLASTLANKRDVLLRIITGAQTKDRNLVPKAMSTLRHLDEALNDCLKLISNFTGYIIVNLSWTCHQVNPMARLLGFRVYINDQQYGSDLSESIRSIRLKLSLEKAINSIYVTAFSDKINIESHTSNVIEIFSENFFPFTYFCYSNIHRKNTSWPEKGCCAYHDTLIAERVELSKTKEPINIGLLVESQPVPRCEVIDIINSKTRTLFDSKNKTSRPTIVLFWTKWCFSSIKALNFMVMYAKKYNSDIEFVTCHVGHENSSDLYELLKKGGYSDSNVKFFNDIYFNTKSESGYSSSLESFNFKGVPTFLVIKNDRIVWRGRYCVYDLANFENFLLHTVAEVNGVKCPVHACDLCSSDISIDKELSELRIEQKLMNQHSDSFIKPIVADGWSDVETTGVKRTVPRLPKIGSKQLVAIKPNSSALKSDRTTRQGSLSQIIGSYVIKKNFRPNSSEGQLYYKQHAKKC